MRNKILVIITIILASAFMLAADEPIVTVPDFTLPDFEGNEVTLSDFEGLIIIDFWASWCPPCREEVPVLQQLYDDYKEQGVDVIGISNEEVEVQQAFRERMNEKGVAMDYTLLVDEDLEVFRDYDVEGIPTTIFVKGDLTQIYREVGFTPEYEDKFREIIEHYIEENQ